MGINKLIEWRKQSDPLVLVTDCDECCKRIASTAPEWDLIRIQLLYVFL